MWLINTDTLKLEEFQGKIPTYAILSHTWGAEEVSFVDWQKNLPETRKKAGFVKIQQSCQQARADGYGYLWCDTNCIDKRSSAELSEAINSMFNWYKASAVCYAYLSDVSAGDFSSFSSSRWFTRGWTLQELLAPRSLIFFAKDWSILGTRDSLGPRISDITKIKEYHMGIGIYKASISERMSWVANRETTRIEDIAYCMLGIFDINMPLLYGEGVKAFIRLQEEIIRLSNDQSIFCWDWNWDYVPDDWGSVLVPSPKAFANSGSYYINPVYDNSVSYYISNSGLSISLKLLSLAPAISMEPMTHWSSSDPKFDQYIALLDVICRESRCMAGLVLQRARGYQGFVRLPFPVRPMHIESRPDIKPTNILVAGPRYRSLMTAQQRNSGYNSQFAILVTASFHDSVNYLTTTTTSDIRSDRRIITLRPFTPAFFGAVFCLDLWSKIGSRHDVVTIFCFVGVGVEEWGSEPRRYCELLEIRRGRSSAGDNSEIATRYEFLIAGAARNSLCHDLLKAASSADFMDISGAMESLKRAETPDSTDVRIRVGPWNRIADDSRLSVVHITAPILPIPGFRSQGGSKMARFLH
ncbi:hypothetical protein ACLX1H_000513 [Fusarium chlamydosporum]